MRGHAAIPLLTRPTSCKTPAPEMTEQNRVIPKSTGHGQDLLPAVVSSLKSQLLPEGNKVSPLLLCQKTCASRFSAAQHESIGGLQKTMADQPTSCPQRKLLGSHRPCNQPTICVVVIRTGWKEKALQAASAPMPSRRFFWQPSRKSYKHLQVPKDLPVLKQSQSFRAG